MFVLHCIVHISGPAWMNLYLGMFFNYLRRKLLNGNQSAFHMPLSLLLIYRFDYIFNSTLCYYNLVEIENGHSWWSVHILDIPFYIAFDMNRNSNYFHAIYIALLMHNMHQPADWVKVIKHSIVRALFQI